MRSIVRAAVLLLALVCPYCAPSAAVAATAFADVRFDEELEGYAGPVRFTAAHGETNRVTVTSGTHGIVFSDAANPVHARGDCRPLNRHSARCPFTEEPGPVRLRDGHDFARIARVSMPIHGGEGDDDLVGTIGYDVLDGGGGDDTLRGRGDSDQLTGGAGRDLLDGGGGDDVLLDGETDAQATRDIFIGGTSADSANADKGDTVDYARRRKGLRIDLGRRTSSVEDRLRGMESIVGGRGADRLAGDGDDNWLVGGPGDDVLHGRAGQDIPQGGSGDDRAYGDGGSDVVWGDEGRDRLFGGRGTDFVISLEEQGHPSADALDCGDGTDDARSDSADTLRSGCESITAFSNGLQVAAQPTIDSDSADFKVSCFGELDGCKGALTLRAPDGPQLGTSHFIIASDVENASVSVSLTPAAAAALSAGSLVQVDLVPDTPSDLQERGGYRVFMRAT